MLDLLFSTKKTSKLDVSDAKAVDIRTLSSLLSRLEIEFAFAYTYFLDFRHHFIFFGSQCQTNPSRIVVVVLEVEI